MNTVKLTLIRHGQSNWNLQNRFTGWVNVDLSEQGKKEAKEAGKILQKEHFDLAFTSTLKRAQDTLREIIKTQKKFPMFQYLDNISHKEWYSFKPLPEMDKDVLPVKVSHFLNERYYGDLQGLNKDDAKIEFGEEQVHLWRRSYDVPPPNGESLKDTYFRTVPFFKTKVMSELDKGKNIIISAHGNSLRAIMKYIEKIPDEEIPNLELSTGKPYYYEYNTQTKIFKKL